MTDPAVYQVNDTCVYPASCVMSTRPLAYQVDADDGAGGSNLTTYKYFDGRYDRWSRRWLGFAKIESLSTATGTRRRTLTFDNQTNTYGASPTADSTSPATAYRGFPFAGLIKQDKVEVLEIATATEHETRTDNVWVLRAASAGTSAPLQNYAVELQSETQRTYDLLYSKDPIRTVQTIYDRDKYGNENAVTRKYTKPGSAPEVITTTYDWDRDEASWAFAPSGRTDVHQAADGRKVTRYLDIDNEHSSCSSCLTAAVIQGYRPSAVIRDADTFLQGMTEAYEYDAYGNITDISHIGPSSTRITTVIFDAEHTFPVEITNPLAQTAHLTWDPMLGKPVLSESPYGVKLWMKHDSFGRLIWRQSEDRDGNASGDEVELTYAMAPGSTRLLTTVVSADGRQATTEHDGFERPIAAETSGVDQDVQQLATYDRFGRLARVSKAVPVGATVKEGQRYLYDGIGRVRKRRLIDASVDWGDDPGPGQSIVFEQAYSGLTETHYDPEGNRTDYQVDALGQIVRVTDDVGTAFCYRYAPFGGIDRVAKGCEKPPWQELVEYERDRWGRVTSVIDPSGVGNRSYTYNAFGEPWTSTDGNGVVTTLTHDDLGRLVSLENADLFHEWLYDQLPPSGALPAGGPPAPGMLVGTVGATGHVREHDYDALGRLSTTLTRVGNEVFEVHRTYDASGHLEDIDYPSPGPGAAFGVRHVYDGVGNLRAVLHKQSGLALWTLQAADADGQPLLEGYGNGRSTVREFDPTTGAQLSVRTGTIAGGVLGSQIQNLSSTWTKNGNLHARTDHLHGQTETFFYDTLDRLTGSEVERQQEITTTPTISYDRFGNITTHPTLGTIVSGPGGRALSLNGSAWHVYDDNGNVLSAPDLTVDWNTLNRPTLITTGGEQVHLEYDADGAEIVRESNDGELTIRIDGGYERTSRQGSIENKYHVAAGGRVVAMARIKTAAPNLVEWSYLHNDTLGSTHVVSNQAGDAIQLISTDAWGVHRGPNWADPDDPGGVLGGVDTSAYQEVNVGYTGHRAQLDGGLVNMGARHYAAQASRFLRADPFIHDAYDTQAYSRYSYARNNPTTNTDPSGRFLSFGGGSVAYCGIFNGIPVVGGLFGLTVGLFDLLSPSSQDMEAGDAAGTRRSASTADARQSASYASREGGPAVATRPSRGAMTAGTDAQAYGVRMWSPKHGPMASQEHWNGAGRQVMPVMAAQAWYSVFEDPEQVGWAIPKPGTGGDVMGIFDMEGNLLGEDIDASESEGHLYVQAALMLTPIRMPAAALRGATAAERIVASGASAEASGIAGGAAGHAAADAVAARVALGGPESVAWVLPQLPKALGGGTRNVHVYFGVGVDGERIYVGITNDIVRRQAAHSSRMVGLEEVTTHAVTRGEARAIEQALIERFRATFLNKINSISPRHKWQQDAINWGESWLRARGI
jgi:RHS repeat-associated protein